MKRILATLLVTTMVFCSLIVPGLAETDRYTKTIENLYLYMSNPKDSGQDIKSIIQDFTLLGNEGFSTELIMYSMMVQYIIDEDDLTTAEMYADVLTQMSGFTNYIEAERDGLATYMLEHCGISDGRSSIIPVWQIQAYIEGREAEARGDVDVAREKYLQCVNFYDARDRMLATLGQQDIVDKEAIFKEAMACYADGELEKTAQLLAKIKDDHAAAQSMYALVVSEMNKSAATQTPEPVKTPKVTSEPKATSKPKATATPAPVVIYSDWVTEVPAGVNIVDTKTQYRRRNVSTEYRYRDLITKTTTESSLGGGWTPVRSELVYGEWSGYTESPISASATLEVEQATRDVQKEVTVWNYSRWEYKHVDYPNLLYYSCIDYSKQRPDKVAAVYGWKSTSSTTRFTQAGSKSGCTIYKNANGVTWYNETSSTKTETQQVTMYRSRSKTMKYTFQSWGSWSDWSGKSVSGSSTKQVETRNAYGSWSAWQDGKMDANGGEVQSRKLYRYQIQ